MLISWGARIWVLYVFSFCYYGGELGDLLLILQRRCYFGVNSSFHSKIIIVFVVSFSSHCLPYQGGPTLSSGGPFCVFLCWDTLTVLGLCFPLSPEIALPRLPPLGRALPVPCLRLPCPSACEPQGLGGGSWALWLFGSADRWILIYKKAFQFVKLSVGFG